MFLKHQFILGLTVVALFTAALPTDAVAQSRRRVRQASIPPLPAEAPEIIEHPMPEVVYPDPDGGYPVPEDSYAMPDGAYPMPEYGDCPPEFEPSEVGLPEYQGRFLSPKCELGRCKSCERASSCCLCECWSESCLTKSIWNLLPCACKKKSRGCACPPHFFCPRGHCRARYTECVRIDYRAYETDMEPYPVKAGDTANYEAKTAKVERTVELDLYPVFEPCCRDFWLEDDIVYADDVPCCLDCVHPCVDGLDDDCD